MGNQVPGNNLSGSIGGNFIHIQTDKPTYYAGETVTGCVFVQITAQFPANAVFLKFKGEEESYWREIRRVADGQEPDPSRPGAMRTKYVEKQFDHYSEYQFYKHKIPLYQFSGVQFIPPGQYTFPFSFLLQNDLPGAFYERSDAPRNKFYGRIEYKVKAELESMNKSISNDLKSKQDLIVREPLKMSIQEVKGEMTVNAKTWCCLDQGFSKISCSFERNFYMPGETANIITEIDNSKCGLEVTTISCIMRQHLSMNFGPKQKNTTTSVSSFQFNGLGKGLSAMGDQARQTPLTLGGQDQVINPSTNGKYIQCQYDLQVMAVLSGCTCCGSNPHVNAPIVIMPPPPFYYGSVQPPPNWSPQVYGVNNIVFSPAQIYPGKRPEGSHRYDVVPVAYKHMQQNGGIGGGGGHYNQGQQQHNNQAVKVQPSYGGGTGQQQQFGMGGSSQMNFGNQPQQGGGHMTNPSMGMGGMVAPGLGGVVGDRIYSATNGLLNNGQMIKSPTQEYYAKLQEDGNFVLYKTNDHRPHNAIWSSNSYGKGRGPYQLKMQGDGNLVLYDSTNSPTWSSETWQQGTGPYSLVMQDDANLVLYDSVNTPTWSTNTYGK